MKERKEYFTIPEIAKLLNLSRITVYRKVKSGKIPAVRVGRNYLIKDKSLGRILGNKITEKEKNTVDRAVKKAIEGYRDVFKWLSKE